MASNPKPPAELTAEEWREIAKQMDFYAEMRAQDAAMYPERIIEHPAPEVARFRALAAACRAMAVGCDPTLRVAPVDDSGWDYPCAVEIAGRVIGQGDTIAAALLDAAGEG